MPCCTEYCSTRSLLPFTRRTYSCATMFQCHVSTFLHIKSSFPHHPLPYNHQASSFTSNPTTLNSNMSIIDVPQWFFKVSLVISFLGVCSHWLHFRRGEFDLSVWKYIIAALVVQAVAVGVLESLGWGLFNSGVLILLLSLSYFLPLFFSIAVYRLFLHPLRKFPGPTWARLSMFWKMNKMIRQNPYQMIDEMHRKYGPVVRLGKRAVFDVDNRQ
jgi:hypothetical protein